MNHRPTTLALTAIVAAIAVTGIAAMATPVFAGGHHHNNGIKVNQQVSQANVCTGVNEESGESPTAAENENTEKAPAPTICLNTGTNTADISR